MQTRIWRSELFIHLVLLFKDIVELIQFSEYFHPIKYEVESHPNNFYNIPNSEIATVSIQYLIQK